MSRVVLPAANANDLETLPEEVLEQLDFDLVRTMDEVMDAVLAHRAASSRTTSDTDLGISASHG
jgi:ATP-dependent Lon protease